MGRIQPATIAVKRPEDARMPAPSALLFVGRETPSLDEIVASVRAQLRVLQVCHTLEEVEVSPEPIDIILSVNFGQVLPVDLLERAHECALNVHPGPPERPGVGAISFAIMDGDETFGVTVHVMERCPDRGEIVDLERFPMDEEADYRTVEQATQVALRTVLKRLVEELAQRRWPRTAVARWGRPPTTRAAYEALLHNAERLSESESKVARAFPGARFFTAHDLWVEMCAAGLTWTAVRSVWLATHGQLGWRGLSLAFGCLMLWGLRQRFAGWRTGRPIRMSFQRSRLGRLWRSVCAADPLLTADYARGSILPRLLRIPTVWRLFGYALVVEGLWLLVT